MNAGCGALRGVVLVAGCLLLALQPALAQNAARKPAPNSPQATRALMVEKAHALEARGRPDLAIQLWQQILLSDPNNVDSLAGLARDLKLTGSDKAIEALDHLRRVSPNDPDIAKIQGLASTRAENAQLRQAGELARQGKNEDAMRIYRQMYGGRPPDGDIALDYFQTLYGTVNGKQEAVSAMRALAARNPSEPRFAVELGVMLTNEQKTRVEGMRILRQHPQDANAQSALRQAMVVEAASPSSAPGLRAYAKEHPQGTELAGPLKQNESKLAQTNAGIARTPAERTAFAALNAKHLDEAEKRFTAILDEEPNNGRAAAGMGFLRMQQNNFPDAIDFLKEAEKNGYKDRAVEEALTASRFWSVMADANAAFKENRLEVAGPCYQEALGIRPGAREALNGLAGTLTRQQQYSAAALVYDQLVKAQPDSTDGWRGLFFSYARDNQSQKALDVEARIPATVTATLAKDPEYLSALVNLYQAENRGEDAQRVLALALALPFPDNGANLKAETRLQYAGILMQAKRYDQAAALFAQMLAEDPGNLSAWIGLIGAQHELGQDTQALEDVKKMPPASYETAVADPAFLTILGAIYRQANQSEVAQGLLERAAKLQIAAGGQPSVPVQLQLAGIYLLRDDADRAYGLYRQVLQSNPGSADAWKGLIAALLATNRTSEAVQQIVLIPAPVRKELDGDIEFVQSEASVYAATGDLARATGFMNRVQAHYAKLHTDPPPAIEIQNAWLLFNTGNDCALYPALMRLGSRAGLTAKQRETIQDIWANWSVRRATAAMDNGSVQRAVDILDAAFQAFPDDLAVRKAVADGYIEAGRAKESLAIYKTISMQDASASDFQGAIGAALAANDKNQAELWLRQALERFPRDPAVLSLAARYEQARGDNQRAAGYYRASLAAMPSLTPAQNLAHALVYPKQDSKAHRAVTAADLERLLDPNNEPFPKTTNLPPLPGFGPDPANGSAPVVLTPAPAQMQKSPIRQIPAQPSSQDLPPLAPPSAGQSQSPNAPVYVPQSYARPRPRIASGTGKPSNNTPRMVYATYQINRRSRMPQISLLRPGIRPIHIVLAQSHASAQRETNPSDAWKGLVLSLKAANRNADALHELAKIPPDVRGQLEADVEFVQAEADLYVSVGDIGHAAETLSHEERLYLTRHAAVSASVEVEHAFLLDNLADDRALRPVLQRLDARADLTASQRRQVQGLWARSATRQGSPPIQAQTQTGSKPNPSASLAPYMGKMHLPPSEETIDSTGPAPASQSPRPPSVWTPRSTSGAPNPAPSLRIASQPMGPLAAQAQALFADQTDGQLTQGSAAAIHSLANAPVTPHSSQIHAPSGVSQYNMAQYTPSTQEAAIGAYSAPRQQQQPAPPPQANATPQQCVPRQCAALPVKRSVAHSAARRKKPAPAAFKPTQPATPTLAEAPAQSAAETNQSLPQFPPPADVQAAPPAPTTGTGLTDEELQQRNLPPLRGPWMRIQRQPHPVSPRDEAEMQLHAIEAGYSPWLGGAGVIDYRPGSLGYDHLAALEAPFEASMPLGFNTRLTIVAKPVFLDSGQADGSSTITVQESTSSGSALVVIPQPIGTLTATNTNIPAQQNAVGFGGEVQMAFPHLALAGGYTPSGFLVATYTGRAHWKPANGPFSFNFSRDPVRDTQLSYAGMRDPGGNTLGNLGQIWGGVVANQGQVQFAHGDADSGFYLGAGGQYLTGHTVQVNTRFDGSGGAYWRIKTMPEYGDLSIGASFFGMHYAHNQEAFTHGMGGYFSPQSYFLADVPFTWTAHYSSRWHYNVLGSLGVQALQQDLTPLWPLAVDKPLETAMSNAMLPAKTSVGPNYDVRSQVAYQIGPHWFAGGFFGANNTRNFATINAGFSVHYMFRTQPSTAAGPTGIFPVDGLRPFTVP